jgi:hypothetical protein
LAKDLLLLRKARGKDMAGKIKPETRYLSQNRFRALFITNPISHLGPENDSLSYPMHKQIAMDQENTWQDCVSGQL